MSNDPLLKLGPGGDYKRNLTEERFHAGGDFDAAALTATVALCLGGLMLLYGVLLILVEVFG